MDTPKNTFRPEDVDVDIDQLLKARQQRAHALPPKARLVSEMRELYIRERYEDESQLLVQAWERIAQQIQSTEEQRGAEMPISLQNHRIAKENRYMQDHVISRNYDKGKTSLKRLSGIIVSGLVAALLIASAILIISYHQQSMSSHSSQTASQNQHTQPQTPAPGTKVPGPASSEISIQWMGTGNIQPLLPHDQKISAPPTETYTFHTGQTIGVGYVAKSWQNTNRNNTFTLKWYQNGTFYMQREYPDPIPPFGKTEGMIQGTVGGVVYNQPGSDKVEIYWGNQLAWTIYFAVK